MNPEHHTHTCKITHSCISVLPSSSSSVERGGDDVVYDDEEDNCKPKPYTTHS